MLWCELSLLPQVLTGVPIMVSRRDSDPFRLWHAIQVGVLTHTWVISPVLLIPLQLLPFVCF